VENASRRPEKKHSGAPNQPERESGPEKEARVLERVRGFSESLCGAEGLELVHVEYLRDRGGRVLRLYIDRPGGVTVDDCAHVSRQLGDWLDVSLDDIGPYSLEVSSPGPERPVGKASDFDRFRGRKAKISISPPRQGRKNFTGFLGGVSNGKVSLETAEGVVEISLAEIRKARLVDGE
jgi:ribosome maturation factor RimP